MHHPNFRFGTAGLLALLLAACGTPDGQGDPRGGSDGGDSDGGRADGGRADGGATDGGGSDGGGADGGGTDGGSSFRVTVSVAGDGDVVSSPAGINCGSQNQCSATFVAGTTVSLSRSPRNGATFQGWSGDVCSGSGPCSLTLSSDVQVTATFEPPQTPTYTVTVTLAGAGAGSVSASRGLLTCSGATCTGSYSQGTSVTLYANPSSQASSFTGWGAGCSGTGNCELVLDGDTAVTATFARTFELSVTLAGGGFGQVTSDPAGLDCYSGTCTARFPEGATVTLSQTTTSYFSGWSGGCSGSAACGVTMSADVTVIATFVQAASFTVTVGGSGSGTVSSDPPGLSCSQGSCSGSFPQGASVTLSASPDLGSALTRWDGACSGAGTCTFTVNGGESVTATFDKLDFGLALEPSSSPFSILPGESRTLTVRATHLRGPATAIALAASGLPAGVTASFTPPTIASDGASVLTLDASGTAALASGSLVVTGLGAGETRETSTSLELRDPVGLFDPRDLVLESGGATALVVEADRLVRVSATTHQAMKTVASGLAGASALALEAGGASALVGIYSSPTTSAVVRVQLATGEVTHLATVGEQVGDLAIESGGGSVLVSSYGALSRVALATGEVTRLNASVTWATGIALEAGGTTALVADVGRLVRINLSTGSLGVVMTTLSAGVGDFQGSLVFESSGKVLARTGQCLTRLDLSAGTATALVCNFAGKSFALQAEGKSVVLADHRRLLRVHLDTPVALVASGLGPTQSVAVESGGATALVGDEGGWSGPPRLWRVNLASGASTLLATITDNWSTTGLAIEASGDTALMGGFAPNLLRVELATGLQTTVSRLLSFSGAGVAIEAGGASALIPGGYTLQRVDLATGAVTAFSSNVLNGGIVIEPGGTSALVAGSSGSVLQRVPLDGGAAQTLVDNLPRGGNRDSCAQLALEADGEHVLLMNQGGNEPRQALMLRINTTTRAVEVIAAGFTPDQPYSCGVGGVAVESASSALVADRDEGLKRVTLPAP